MPAALPVTRDPVVHAVRRLGYGLTPALLEHVRAVGLEAWLDEQLGLDPLSDAGLEAQLGLAYPELALPSTALLAAMRVAEAAGSPLDPVRDVRAATALRQALATRQVVELLVELLSDHLTVCPDEAKVGWRKAVDDREVVRAHALGRYEDLLVASATSPAMLHYLDQATSRGVAPNENYARELLELHTVGVAAGYTQRDVRAAALALSGLTVDETTERYTFRPEWHHVGALQVLDWSHPNDDAAAGEEVALSLVRHLARHPATARHLSRRVARRLVGDRPSAALVEGAARAYLESGTSVVAVLRHVVRSGEFARSAGAKVQRPAEWLAAAVRALGLAPAQGSTARAGREAVTLLRDLGQLPFGWRPPDGYPDVVAAWATNAGMLARWAVAQRLVAGDVPGWTAPDVAVLVGEPAPSTVGELADRLVTRMLAAPLRPGLRDALVSLTASPADRALDDSTLPVFARAMAALVLSSPEGQVR